MVLLNRRLLLFVSDFFKRRGYEELSSQILQFIKLDEVTSQLEERESDFLFSWWCSFWKLYINQRNCEKILQQPSLEVDSTSNSILAQVTYAIDVLQIKKDSLVELTQEEKVPNLHFFHLFGKFRKRFITS